MGVGDVAPERSKDAHRAVADREDLVVDGRHAEVAAPRDAPALERRCANGPGERARVHRIRERRARIGTRDGREHQRGVGHGAGHRALDAPGLPREPGRPDGDEARRGPEAHDAAEGGGDPQGAAEVGALGELAHTRRERHAAAAGRAAAGQRRVPRIAGRAEDGVEGVGARAELGGVGLAEDDRARRLQALHHERVVVGHAVLEDLRALGRADALREREVLDRDRHAMERPERRTARERGGGPPRRLERLLRGDRAIRVQRRIHLLDPREDRARHLERRHPAAADQRRERGGGGEAELRVGHRHLSRPSTFTGPGPCGDRARRATHRRCS